MGGTFLRQGNAIGINSATAGVFPILPMTTFRVNMAHGMTRKVAVY
jgi:hypothetical protein